MKKREPIKEARRYVDNAREILDERGKLDDAIPVSTLPIVSSTVARP